MSNYTRITTWSEGQILTASDLNAEENNHIMNGPPNHASQHASGAVDDIKAYYLSLASGGTVAGATSFSSRINEAKGADIAAATTMDIGAASGNFIDITGDKGTVTMTSATPAVFSKATHGLVLNDTVVFTTTGALYTGLTAGTVYFVIAAGLTADAFEVSASQGGAAVNTSGSQSGVHSVQRAITTFDSVQAGAERALRFNGQLTLVYDVTKMILPGAVNVTTAAGQIIVFKSLGSGIWICSAPAFSVTPAANVVPVSDENGSFNTWMNYKIRQQQDLFASGYPTTGQIGSLGWMGAGTGGISLEYDATNLEGRCVVISGSSATNTAMISYSGTGLLSADHKYILEQRMAVDSTSNIYIKVGSVGSNATAQKTGENGIYFYSIGGNWFAITRTAAAETSTDTSVALSANTIYSLKIVRRTVSQGGINDVRFYINGTLVATHTTNIPASGAGYSVRPIYIVETSTTAAKTLYVYYFNFLGIKP